MIFPYISVFLVLIPFYLFFKLKIHVNRLSFIRFQFLWGYLYTEYKLEAYFWEFLKMFVKIGFIFFMSFYNYLEFVKGCFLLFILFFYEWLLQKYKPNYQTILNYLDKLQTKVIQISLIIVLFLLQNNLDYLIFIGYFFLVLFNIIYILTL